MQKKTMAAGAVFLAILAVAAFFMSGSGSGSAQLASGNATTTAPVLFASSSIARYSYLVSDQNLSLEAQAALSGYSLTYNQLPDGSENVTITINLSGASQTVNVKQGDRLYVVETAFGDDSGSYDSSFADDGFVMVNQSGYLV